MAHSRKTLLSMKPKTERAPSRPSDLIYWLDDRPPLPRLVMLGLQHVVVICPYLVFATLVLKAAHAPVDVATSAVGLAMLGIAIMTVLQVQRLGLVGSGFVAPPVVSAISFAPAIYAAERGGLAAVCGMIGMAGVFEAIFAWILPHARKIFSPVVSGLIVMAVAVELGLIGIHALLGLASAHESVTVVHARVAGPAVATGFMTLAVMVAWASGAADWRVCCAGL